MTAAGSGYTKRSGAFDNITEDRVVSATGSYAGTATQNSNVWVMQLVAFRAASASSDTTPPNVSITAPTGGTTVSGSVTVTANASDNVAVQSVQFLLDSNPLGALDTTSPYSISWDTTLIPNGSHTLSARATDTSGNTALATNVVVTVSNAVAPSAEWPMYFQNIAHSGFSTGNSALTPTSAANLQLKWQVSDTGNPESGVFSQPVVSNGSIYWGSWDGYERASDTSGHQLWQTYLGHTVSPGCTDPDAAGVSSTASITTDVPIGSATSVLYVGGGDTNVYALNAATGAILWSTSLGQNPDHFIWSSPAVIGNSVYIGLASFGTCPDVQGRMYQLNRVTGAIQNFFNTVPDGCTGGGVWSSPTIDAAAGTLYFTTGNPDPCANGSEMAPAMIELRLSDLSLVGQWTLPDSEQVHDCDVTQCVRFNDSDFGATPTLFNGVIGGVSTPMVGAINKNGRFYAFTRDALANGPDWRAQVASGGGNPTVGTGDVAVASWDGTTLFVGGDHTTIGSQDCSGSVNALDPSTGNFKWRSCINDTGFVLGGVTAGDGGIVVAGENNHINVYNAATGDTVYTFTGTGPFFGSASIANGNIYEGDMSGHMYDLAVSGGGGTTTTTTSTSSTSSSSSSTSSTSSSTTTTTGSTSTSTSTTTTTMPSTGGSPKFVQVNSVTPTERAVDGDRAVYGRAVGGRSQRCRGRVERRDVDDHVCH